MVAMVVTAAVPLTVTAVLTTASLATMPLRRALPLAAVLAVGKVIMMAGCRSWGWSRSFHVGQTVVVYLADYIWSFYELCLDDNGGG